MFDSGPGSSNGFFEKAALLIVVVGSLIAGGFSANVFISLWYLMLAAITLYLAWHFDQFSFSGEAWRQEQAIGWSSQTLGEAPTDYIDAVGNVRDQIAPGHSTLWWIFRVVYVLIGLSLLASGLERLVLGTDAVREAFLSVILQGMRYGL